jgi:aminocarboxymuconate-semialdehyde decarboxylase
VDSVVFNDASLRLLTDVMGSEHIMLGSDFPYPLGERPAGNLIRKSAFLTREQQSQILSSNAQKFLGMDVDADIRTFNETPASA